MNISEKDRRYWNMAQAWTQYEVYMRQHGSALADGRREFQASRDRLAGHVSKTMVDNLCKSYRLRRKVWATLKKNLSETQWYRSQHGQADRSSSEYQRRPPQSC